MNISSNEVAIVTGASSGIGRAVAIELSRDLPVLAIARNEEGLLETANLALGCVTPVVGDVCDPTGRQRVIDVVGTKKVRCLLHLAGGMPIVRIAEMPEAEWEQTFVTHVHSRLYLTLALLTNLTPNGRVIFVGSMSATKARQGATAYCTSYAASMMLASCLKLELADENVEVINAIPGAVPTPLLMSSINSDPDVFPDRAEYRRLGQLGKWTEPKAVGKFFAWLAVQADGKILRGMETIAISDEAHHKFWLGSERLFHPGRSL